MNNITIASPTVTPEISPRSASSDRVSPEPTFTAVHLTLREKVTAFLCAFFTGGAFLLYQSFQLQKALQMGNIQEAEQAIRNGGWWLYSHTIESDDVVSLALTKQIESVHFLFAQIHFDGTRNGGTPAADAYICARPYDYSKEIPKPPLNRPEPKVEKDHFAEAYLTHRAAIKYNASWVSTKDRRI